MKINFNLTDDYEDCINKLRPLSEAQIRGWRENPNLSPTQLKAMDFVLGEKEKARHNELKAPDTIARWIGGIALLVAIIALLNDLGAFGNRSRTTDQPPKQQDTTTSPMPHKVDSSIPAMHLQEDEMNAEKP